MRGLYAGVGPTLSRAFPANAAAIVAWELTARVLHAWWLILMLSSSLLMIWAHFSHTFLNGVDPEVHSRSLPQFNQCALHEECIHRGLCSCESENCTQSPSGFEWWVPIPLPTSSWFLGFAVIMWEHGRRKRERLALDSSIDKLGWLQRCRKRIVNDWTPPNAFHVLVLLQV